MIAGLCRWFAHRRGVRRRIVHRIRPLRILDLGCGPGNTLRRPACVHWTGRDACAWLGEQRSAGSRIVGVELADEAIRLADLPAARQRTIAVLGHERTGIPPEAIGLLDVAVEIPMIGTGASLNVAVAGSLVLYRLAGLI